MDGIEAELSGRADVIRLDILSEFGRAAAWQFGVQAVPTVVLVNGAGELTAVFAGIPNRGVVTAAVIALLAAPAK